MRSSLVLIGVVHRDPDGEQKLRLRLEELEPFRVTLEVSRYAVSHREKNAERWRDLLYVACRRVGVDPSHPALVSIEALFEVPYEYRAARAYCDAHGRTLHLLGSDARSNRLLQLVERELITPRNVETLVTGDPPPPFRRLVAAQYGKAALHLDGGLTSSPLAPEDAREEERMARSVRSMLVRHQTLAHVAGWEHLVRASDRLAAHLADLDPHVVLLDS